MSMVDDAMAGLTKGAAMGSVFMPGVGTAIGAGVGGLAGVVLSMIPNADRATAAKITDTVASIVGTTPEAQAAALADPQIQADLRQTLAQIAADRDAAMLADVQNAREQTKDLAKTGSTIAWGAPVVSAVFLLMFMVDMGWLYFAPTPTDSATLAALSPMHTTIQNAIIAVISYWIGSSAGSARKDDRIGNIAQSK